MVALCALHFYQMASEGWKYCIELATHFKILDVANLEIRHWEILRSRSAVVANKVWEGSLYFDVRKDV